MTSRLLEGDCRDVLKTLPAASVQTVCTSPPYWGLRSYLPADHPDKTSELGAEPTSAEYVANLVAVFREVRRVLRDDGTLWLVLGDSYASGGNGTRDSVKWPKQSRNNNGDRMTHTKRYPGSGVKPKDLIGIPWLVAKALQADGWYLRSAMPWIKRNVMPESTTDRPTSAIEHVFLLTKQPRYFFDHVAVNRDALQPLGKARSTKQHKAQFTGHLIGPTSTLGTNQGDARRSYRNSDPWFDSLDVLIEQERAYLADLEAMREHGGLLSGEDDAPLALDVNPKGFPGSHFAAFPERLVEPMIRAGSSERGACPACGAPWSRVVEREQGRSVVAPKAAALRESGEWAADKNGTSTLSVSGGSAGWAEYGGKARTTGWQPTCTCDGGDPIPCTVLDPFGGAGTTGVVAARLGRDAVLIELNDRYVELAAARIRGASPMFNRVEVA